MLYFLLAIIAIGVLLASEEGKAILGCLVQLAIVGVILFVGFWAVVLIWVFFSEKNTRDTVLTVIGTIALIWAAIYVLYEKRKQGKLTKQAIKTKAAEIWKQHFSKQTIKTKIIENWKRHPLWVIFWIITSLAIIYLCVTGNIK